MRRWRKKSREVRKREPLCRPCRKRGYVVAATEVDHIVPRKLGGTDDDSNLQPICFDCHVEKTTRENRTGNLGACEHGTPFEHICPEC